MVIPTRPTRSGPNQIVDDLTELAKGQLCLVFACAPVKLTSADSTMIRQVFDRFREVADPRDGTFNLSMAFLEWEPEGGEITSAYTWRCCLQHANWEVPEGFDNGRSSLNSD